MRLRRVAAMAIATTMLLAACNAGGGSSAAALKPVRLQLQWLPQEQFCGYYAALDQGFYKDQGLDVTILPGAVDIVPATVVAAGNAEFGISWLPKALASRENGADIQFIGQPFQRSPTLQIAFKDKGITKPTDWKGKKVGSWGYGNEAELYAAIRKAGLDPNNPADVTIVNQDFTMNAFVNGDIDAAQAMQYNEYAQVLETKNPTTGELYKPEDLDVISMQDAGTSMLQDGIFADESWLKESGNEDTAVAFLTAAYKGWQFCRDNPDKAVDMILKYDAKLPKVHQAWQLNEVNKLIWPSPNGIGTMDQALYDQTVQIATDGKILTKPVEGQAFRNDLTAKALKALEGTDTTGASWTPTTVTLTAGGQ